ncbi:MAG: hypothetical protein GT601_19060 [Acidaminobacter sp.]|uniref:hypothetical protein n=1 Tax=Acidaminobacter sp. TaxID=1872102 RepID=UPI001384468E|nr:hypothetical protein [Acidaminobacter sp.]MZQ99771.1 hypothetical protein [Acidaminobacter sp.]
MRKSIALLLISMMVLTLTAFSFADNGNPMKDKNQSGVNAFVLDDDLFITVWLDAEVGDILKEISVEINDDDDVIAEWFDDFEVSHEFGSKVFKYTFEAVDYTPADEFEITVFADFSDGEDQVLTKKVDLEDLDKEDNDEDDEDDEEDLDEDMDPAAPAVANRLLKEADIPNRVEGVNLIALVAGEMNEEEPFGLDEIEDLEDLEVAVEGFLVDQLNDMLGKTHNDLADFTDHFTDTEKTVGKPVVEKMKPQQLDNDDDEDDEDDDDEDDDDEDDDDDDDDEDNDNKGENPGKGNKK